ncbi:hypothetical protein EHS25_009560 [Saitozyma podzolica]|uniref:acylphosphatase n=1 Tax=Saitozyma podzolica TaxID=1890683 RepID=A0A427YJL0_9TREE|nr:hypothetical protein EHS25_009560 [Saitozyma podzolica]
MGNDLIHYKVTGEVQGVNFRYYTQKEGNKLGLRGWVRNERDSSVEGVAAGPADKVKEFRVYLQKGPSAATVEKLHLVSEKHDASEEEISKALGGGSKGYEVR